MDQQRYYDRKQYVEEARSSFDARPEKRGREEREHNDAEAAPRSFFKLRLFLSAILVAGFFLMRVSGWSCFGIGAAAIEEKIKSSISLPDSFSNLSELVTIAGEK
ncbi:MAG: hypothetical protein LUD53_05250 [Clostridiales bacterium]|nr:hypothetical protein [Clostridiales bacterium]